MAIYDNFPYTNIHDLNLEWILKTVKECKELLDNFGPDYSAGANNNFIYFKDGVATASDYSMGDTVTPIYIEDGIIKGCAKMHRIIKQGNVPSNSIRPDYPTGTIWLQYGNRVVNGQNVLTFGIYWDNGTTWDALFTADMTNKVIL